MRVAPWVLVCASAVLVAGCSSLPGPRGAQEDVAPPPVVTVTVTPEVTQTPLPQGEPSASVPPPTATEPVPPPTATEPVPPPTATESAPPAIPAEPLPPPEPAPVDNWEQTCEDFATDLSQPIVAIVNHISGGDGMYYLPRKSEVDRFQRDATRISDAASDPQLSRRIANVGAAIGRLNADTWGFDWAGEMLDSLTLVFNRCTDLEATSDLAGDPA